MTRFTVFFLLCLSLCQDSRAYNNRNVVVNRRDWIAQGVAGGFAGAAAVIATPEQANAVISSKLCAYGEGEGCDDLAEGNEYIKQLQAKSAANKETIQAVRYLLLLLLLCSSSAPFYRVVH
jgi:hypothetical protein